jgi:hypothetical protein
MLLEQEYFYIPIIVSKASDNEISIYLSLTKVSMFKMTNRLTIVYNKDFL